MQEIIEQILDGNFEYENGALDFSCSKLELTVKAGELYEGSFQISSKSAAFTTGYITTSDYRMECLTPDFNGTLEDISFCFHAEYMEEGEVVKGNFNFVSNHGEYHLPFVVTVEHEIINSSIGTIKNLFHFANLAKSNWMEAVNLFYSPNFKRVFSGTDSKMYDSYRGLCANPGNEQNVEEFLIHINKKQRVEYITTQKELTLELPYQEGPNQVMELELNITRNGWGYTALNVECDGEFLFTEKTILTDDDFLGNRCRLPVYISSSQCRPGKNFGRVVLFNSYVCITIPVEVKVGEHLQANRSVISKQRLIAQMMEYYQAFRMKKISSSTWRKETGALVEKQIMLDENDIAARLFQAQILISEERYNEAEWILDHAEALLERNYDEDDTLYAYYLYLTTLIHREEEYVNQITAKVKKIHRNDYSNWRVAWLLLYLSEEYNKSAASKWMFIEEQYYYGCASPVFYTEAILLLCNNPSLIRKLDEFELQVLNYGAKQRIISAELIEQLVYVCGKNRDFSAVLLKILISVYDIKKDSRILQEICTLLIKGNITNQKYFKWYELGVEQQLRITNLYEYYMMSLDISRPKQLPKVLVMYFSYQNNLDYEHSAYLYDYLVQHKNELPELFATYEAKIKRFVIEQINKLHINRNLASLYQSMLTLEMIDESNVEELSRLLFANLIRVDDYRIKKAIVYQPSNLKPREYTFKDNSTWVSLYGNDYTIVFEDGFGNRFTSNVDYTLEKLMIPGKFLKALEQFNVSCPELDLFFAAGEQGEPSNENMDRLMRVAKSKDVESKFRRELYVKILQYYYDEDDMRSLDEFLEHIPFEELNMNDREKVIKFMVLRGKYDVAYDWIASYGPYFVDSKTLLRLTSQKIEENNYMEDEVLTASALYSFQKGKYDSVLITYLAAYFKGTVKEMRQIWKAAKSFEVDCYKLSEKIIIQMLYSGAFVGEKMEIFRYYVSQGAKQEVEQAFLTQCSYDYFVREKLADEYIFDEIRLATLRGEEVKFVCKLAYLKYYSENKQELNEEKLSTVREFLVVMMDEDIHFNFFREFDELSWLLETITDRTIIEYRAKPGNRCKIHYVRVRENGESDEYLSEYMTEVFAGVCFKEFILFFGESIQYYITEENGIDEQLTESGSVQRSDIGAETGANKYSLINDMVISKTLQDYDTLNDLLMDYYKKEYYNDNLFELV